MIVNDLNRSKLIEEHAWIKRKQVYDSSRLIPPKGEDQWEVTRVEDVEDERKEIMEQQLEWK